jgi:hypothetical protein
MEPEDIPKSPPHPFVTLLGCLAGVGLIIILVSGGHISKSVAAGGIILLMTLGLLLKSQYTRHQKKEANEIAPGGRKAWAGLFFIVEIALGVCTIAFGLPAAPVLVLGLITAWFHFRLSS